MRGKAETIQRIDVKDRFLVGTKLPEPTPGVVIFKLDGEPVQLPAAKPEDPMFGNSRYTEKQARALGQIASQRYQELQAKSRASWAASS